MLKSDDTIVKVEEQDYDQLRERLKAAATTTFDLYTLAEKAIWRLHETAKALKMDNENKLLHIQELESEIRCLKSDIESLEAEQ